MTEYETLVKLVADAAEDVAKFDKGNAAAGTRVRKAMQACKRQASVVRDEVLAGQKARAAK